MTVPGDATRRRLSAGLFASAQQARSHHTDPRRLNGDDPYGGGDARYHQAYRKSSCRLSNCARRILQSGRPDKGYRIGHVLHNRYMNPAECARDMVLTNSLPN
jgi:hypothetical protein